MGDCLSFPLVKQPWQFRLPSSLSFFPSPLAHEATSINQAGILKIWGFSFFWLRRNFPTRRRRLMFGMIKQGKQQTQLVHFGKKFMGREGGRGWFGSKLESYFRKICLGGAPSIYERSSSKYKLRLFPGQNQVVHPGGNSKEICLAWVLAWKWLGILFWFYDMTFELFISVCRASQAKTQVVFPAKTHVKFVGIELLPCCSYSPCLSSMPTTMVSVVPSGTMPTTGLAQGPLPCWISIQQSTLSPLK